MNSPTDSADEAEKELVEEILRSKAYDEFRKVYLQPKVERERRAWKLLGAFLNQ
jgi:hypothetical protein